MFCEGKKCFILNRGTRSSKKDHYYDVPLSSTLISLFVSLITLLGRTMMHKHAQSQIVPLVILERQKTQGKITGAAFFYLPKIDNGTM